MSISILEKLDAVEIKTDTRISETDRRYCEAHQSAYDEARQALIKLREQWKSIVDQQKEILLSAEQESYAHTDYISIDSFSAAAIQAKIEKLPNILVANIVNYFNKTYHVSVKVSEVQSVLIPQKPDKWNVDKEMIAKHHKQMREFSLHYESILDQIFIQLGGRTFVERALDEIKEKCHTAAWNSYRKTADYEIKGDAIRFTGYACKTNDWLSSLEWELSDGMKNILCGMAHFETGAFDRYPQGFSELLGWSRVKYSEIEFNCRKISKLKMFKNHRVDVKFKSKALAQQFAEEYLGLVL